MDLSQAYKRNLMGRVEAGNAVRAEEAEQVFACKMPGNKDDDQHAAFLADEAKATAEPKKSTHKVEVVPVELTRHPNADLLSVIPVWGYSYVGLTSEWQHVKRGAYLPPDSVVDTARPEFAFLAPQARDDGSFRVKAKKLRGVVSYGLMVPVPDDTPLGEDWAERLGVTHYEPPLKSEVKERDTLLAKADVAHVPALTNPPGKYDVDAFLRHHRLFFEGELVLATEKLDGANAKFVYLDGEMHCGSRENWKREFPCYDHLTVDVLVARGMKPEDAQAVLDKVHSKPKRRNLWWDALRMTPELEKFCRDHPGTVVFGEVFGNVNCIKYGFADGKDRFAAFDLWRDGRFLDGMEARDLLEASGVPLAPLVSALRYDLDAVKELAEGPTLVPGAKAGVIREGVVVRPHRERVDPRVGRVVFKCVNPVFLERYR